MTMAVTTRQTEYGCESAVLLLRRPRHAQRRGNQANGLSLVERLDDLDVVTLVFTDDLAVLIQRPAASVHIGSRDRLGGGAETAGSGGEEDD